MINRDERIEFDLDQIKLGLVLLTWRNLDVSLELGLLEGGARCLASVSAACLQCSVRQEDRMIPRSGHLVSGAMIENGKEGDH